MTIDEFGFGRHISPEKVLERDLYPRFDARGYEHPVDVLKNPNPNVEILRTRHFNLRRAQKELITEQLGDLAETGIEAMTLMALHGIHRRISEETSSLLALGVDLTTSASDDVGSKDLYTELAGRPEKLGEFTVWFDRAARDALARQLTPDRSKMENPYLVHPKGIGLEVGSAIMGGDWRYSHGLWRAVDDLSPQLQRLDGYTPTRPANETYQPSYTVSLSSEEGFLTIVRERGIWDIITPEADRLYIAHRMVGMVALRFLPLDIRSSAIRAAQRRDSESLSEQLGEKFEEEIADDGATFNGILPESTTVYIRHPLEKAA